MSLHPCMVCQSAKTINPVDLMLVAEAVCSAPGTIRTELLCLDHQTELAALLVKHDDESPDAAYHDWLENQGLSRDKGSR